MSRNIIFLAFHFCISQRACSSAVHRFLQRILTLPLPQFTPIHYSRRKQYLRYCVSSDIHILTDYPCRLNARARMRDKALSTSREQSHSGYRLPTILSNRSKQTDLDDQIVSTVFTHTPQLAKSNACTVTTAYLSHPVQHQAPVPDPDLHREERAS